MSPASSATATSDIIITDRGGDRPRLIHGSDLQCSWEVNLAGALSCRTPIDEIRNAGLTGDLRSYWLEYEHPSAGRWRGPITAAVVVGGVVEIAAQSYAILTRKRVVSISANRQQPLQGSPGAIFRAAFERMNNTASTWLKLGRVDLDGPNIEVSWDREDFYDSIAQQLTTENDFEWRVGTDRVVTFGERLGVDRSSSVELAEGREILADSRWTFDTWPLTNIIVATGLGRTKSDSGLAADYIVGPITVRDNASINRYGPLEEGRDFGYVGDVTTLRTRANRALRQALQGENQAVELRVADVNDAFSKFAEGDTISVSLGLAGVSGTMRVMVRALDVATGVMSVSGIGSAA